MTLLYLTMYYTMEIDKQLKAYYVKNTISLFYLCSVQQIIIKTIVELSTHFYMIMFTN